MKNLPIPFDYFSLPVRGFNIKGQDSSQSWAGFILSITFFSLVLTVFINEFIKMLNREDMTVSIAEIGVPIPPPINIRSIIMAFAVGNIASSTPFIENVDFNIRAELWTFSISGSNPRQLSQTLQPLTIQGCDEAYFGDLVDEMKNLTNIQEAFCIPRTQSEDLFTLEGQLGSDIYKVIRVSVNCGKRGDTACPTSFISSSVTFLSGSSYLDVSNYEHPLTITPTIVRDYADKASYHQKNILITPREIITDKGLAFSNEESQYDLVVSEGPSRIQGLNLMTPEVFSFTIMLSTTKIVVKRQYSKILDVLASATGIASTIALVVSFFLRFYLEEKTHSDVMKNLTPGKYKPITLRDYIKAFMGNKAARQKIKMIKDEKEWVTQNLDVVKTLKNWSDLEKIKKAVLTDDDILVHEKQNLSPLGLGRNRTSFNESAIIDISRIHPK